MKTHLPLFHLRRQLRQHGQELRRAQREAIAAQLATLADLGEQMAAQHRAFMQQQEQAAAQARHLAEAEGSPELLAALRTQIH